MMEKPRILILGACGQLGTELTAALRNVYGLANVFTSDRHAEDPGIGNYTQLDVMDANRLKSFVKQKGISQVFLLAAILSAKGERDADAAWNLNVQSLITVLNIARDEKLDKVFWPSSIAVFGPHSPKFNCPQETRTDPTTVYGISKRAGEYWCNYYFEKYGVDVRSLRFPGLISSSAPAGGGTTDYAVDIFHQAIRHQYFECFLEESTVLPMLYMKDAIRAITEIMTAPSALIKVRTSYNLAGMSFAPCDLAAEIKRHIGGLEVYYKPDHRQSIADSWPSSIDDSAARADWNWTPKFTLAAMTADMISALKTDLDTAPVLQPFPEFQVEDTVIV